MKAPTNQGTLFDPPMEAIYNASELEGLKSSSKGLLVYFSSESCSVCKVLRPKVLVMLYSDFPGMKARYVDIELSPMIAGQLRVFTIPTLLLYFDGKEQHRFSRNISLNQLEEAIAKPYSLLF